MAHKAKLHSQVRSTFEVLVVQYAIGHCHGEGSGTPLQYSCLENPKDGEVW